MKKRIYFTGIIVIACTFVPFGNAFSQDVSGLISLDFTLAPKLETAQILGLASLGVDNRGSGPDLLRGTLRNNTNELLTNLFFEFEIEGGKVGTIARVTQQAAYPFTLDPGQIAYATNNDIVNEAIPGIEETMRFYGGLTPEGDEFIESLGGSTTLPIDIYTFSVRIYQVTNAEGKKLLASQTLELGGSEGGAIVDNLSVDLRTPGDVISANVTITNPYPQFSWEGDAANTYRVLVVEDNGDGNAESLIENAKSSSPVQYADGTLLDGSLQQFENLDFLVRGNTLQYPSSGAQALEVGKTYYWQVTTEVQTAIGTNELTSEIWSFRLADPGDPLTQVEIDQSTFDAIIALIGQEHFATLTSEGYSFFSIELDGQNYSGLSGIQKIAELVDKIEAGDVLINNN